MSDKQQSAREVQSFVIDYTSKNEPSICFAWNGKHADQFVDSNGELRQAVLELVLADPKAAPLELVRDLFKAETEYSKEAWCISYGIGVLAERLLREDPERYLEDYLQGKFQSFDAHCGSAFSVDHDLARRLLNLAEQRLATELAAERREVLEDGKKLFQSWLEIK